MLPSVAQRLSELVPGSEIVMRCAEYLRLICARAGFTARDVLSRGLAVLLAQASSPSGQDIAVLPVSDVRTCLRHFLAVGEGSPVAPHLAGLVDAAAVGYWDRARGSGCTSVGS